MDDESDEIQWEEFFMGVAVLAAQRSNDPETQVGAVLVDRRDRIIGIGWNGMPTGSSDRDMPWGKEAEAKENKSSYVCHAEANAFAFKTTDDIEGARLYTTLYPCNGCAMLIIQYGIKKVFYLSNKKKDKDDTKQSTEKLKDAKVTLINFNSKHEDRYRNPIIVDFTYMDWLNQNDWHRRHEYDGPPLQRYTEEKIRPDRIDWTDYYMGIAILAAKRSNGNQLGDKVGAVLVDQEKRIVCVSWNGSKEKYGNFDTHAAASAIIFKTAYNIRGAKLYTTLFPCKECMKLIIQTGIAEINYLSDKRCGDVEFKAARWMLDQLKGDAKVKLTEYHITELRRAMPLKLDFAYLVNLEVIFLIDTSDDTSDEDCEEVRKFCVKYIKEMDGVYGDNGFRVGVVVAEQVTSLDAYKTKDDIIKAINDVGKTGGRMKVGEDLIEMMKDKARIADARIQLIVLTDEPAKKELLSTIEEISEAFTNIAVYAVCIRTYEDLLKKLSYNGDILKVDNYGELAHEDTLKTLRQKISAKPPPLSIIKEVIFWIDTSDEGCEDVRKFCVKYIEEMGGVYGDNGFRVGVVAGKVTSLDAYETKDDIIKAINDEGKTDGRMNLKKAGEDLIKMMNEKVRIADARIQLIVLTDEPGKKELLSTIEEISNKAITDIAVYAVCIRTDEDLLKKLPHNGDSLKVDNYGMLANEDTLKMLRQRISAKPPPLPLSFN